MDPVLSQSEVESNLSGLDLNSLVERASMFEQNKRSIDGPSLYDFEHPEPLRRAQLESLKLAAAAGTRSLQTSLSRVLQATFEVKFLDVEQSTYRDYLATAETPGCIAVFEAPDSHESWLLDIGRPFSFAMIDCLLGGQAFQNAPIPLGARPYTGVETRLIDRAAQGILPDLAGNFTRRTALRMTNLISDGACIREATSNEAVALVSFEVAAGSNRSLMQLCIPWKEVASPRNVFNGDDRRSDIDLRSQAGNIPVVATVRVAQLKLCAKDLADLNLGDILLTDVSTTDEMTFDVEGCTIFRGHPGQSANYKVIRLTKAVQNQPIGNGERTTE